MENSEVKINVTRERCKRIEVLVLPYIYESFKSKAAKSGMTMTQVLKELIIDYIKAED